MDLLLYFVAGFLLDMLATLDIQAVQKNQAYRSASVSFIGTVLSYWIFYSIIISPDFIEGLISYALGGAVGTILTMKRKSIINLIIKQTKKEFTNEISISSIERGRYSKIESQMEETMHKSSCD